MDEKYLTLKLTISELADGRYRSRIDSSPMGASEGSGHDFSMSSQQIKDWMVQAPLGHAPTRDALAAVGKTLFSTVLDGLVLEKYRQCVQVAEEQKARLRIGLAVLPGPLVAVPWEYLHDGASFLLKSGQHIVRLINTLREKPAYFRPIRRLLVVIANPTMDPTQYSPFDADGHCAELLKHTGPFTVAVLMDPSQRDLAAALRDIKPDSLYFVGHGRYTETLEGQLVLAGPDGSPVYLDADKLAGWVRESSVRFVYLNSCSTAATGLSNPFSGVAQRLMRDGDVDAVVAMQTPVAQVAGLTIAQEFFDELGHGNSPELALARSRAASEDFHSWGIPVVYTYLGGAEDFERNRIACLFGAGIGESRYGVIVPSFGMGVHLHGLGDMTTPARGTYILPAGSGPITVTVDPPKTFVYPGHTHAKDDVQSAVDVLGLLTKIAPMEAIDFYESTGQGRDVTHWILFGSKSNAIVAGLLTNYSPRFKFRYEAEEWFVDEIDENGKPIEPSRKIPIPHGFGHEDFANQPDLGIIEKITDPHSGRVFLIIAGLGSRATRGCGWYLARRWDELVREFGARDFGVMLRFPGGMSFDFAERIELRQGHVPGT